MTKGWEVKKLGDVCSFLNRGVSPKYVDSGGFAVINQRCIRDHRVSYEFARRHDVTTKKVSEEKFLQAGNVLVNSTGVGTLGRVAQLRNNPPEPTTVDSHVTIVRPAKGVFDLAFFGYMLWDIEDELKEGGEGCGGQTELNRSVLAERFTVRYPSSLSEQQRIVSILDETLEGVAAAQANTEKNLVSARALFESHLQSVFSECGANWVKATIGEVNKFIDYRGKTPVKTPSGIRLITAKNVKMGHLQESPMEFIAPGSYKGWMTRGIPKRGDVLFTTEAPLANVAQLDTDEKVAFAQRIIIMQPDAAKLDSKFLKYLLLSQPVQQRIRTQGTGATVQGIKASLLRTVAISFPNSLAEQDIICTRLDALNSERELLEDLYERKLAALDALKRSLLHQAFSGELTKGVPESAVPPVPTNIRGITTTDLHAGILASAYELHERKGRQMHFGHVKAEKIAHMVEAVTGIDLGRVPIKDAAGPNDYSHLLNVEYRARKADYFDFERVEGAGYQVKKLHRFKELILRVRERLGDHNRSVNDLLELMLPMNTQQAEIFCTVYAAWNNLLIDGSSPTDEDIVCEARENWHTAKLKIPRQKFFAAIEWLREKGVVASGKGKKVSAKPRK